MSYLAFSSPSGEALLRGPEWSWLRYVAFGPAKAAWGLDPSAGLDHLAELVSLFHPEGFAGYLHIYLDKARQARPGGSRQPLLSSLELALASPVTDLMMDVAGHQIAAGDVALNTALDTGPRPVQLAAKLTGWGIDHVWVDGPDRAWLADIITEGLDAGIYRSHLRGEPLGWQDVLELLRGRDDGFVVTHHSVYDDFPNRDVAGWQPPPMPAGWRPDWAATDCYNEWLAMPAADQQQEYQERAGELWYDLPSDEQWRLSVAGLRARPFLQLTPESLGAQKFHVGVTIADLRAPDREERVRARFAVLAP